MIKIVLILLLVLMGMILDITSFTKKHPSSKKTVRNSFKSGGVLGIIKVIVIVVVCVYAVVLGFIVLSSYMA